MFCPKCGAQNPDGTVNCLSCGSPMDAARMDTSAPVQTNDAQKVPNYLVWSILATIFCCLPLGIVGIVFAAQVDGKLRAGDYAGAIDASKKAKLFSWIAFGCGLAVALIWGGIVLLGVINGISNSSQY